MSLDLRLPCCSAPLAALVLNESRFRKAFSAGRLDHFQRSHRFGGTSEPVTFAVPNPNSFFSEADDGLSQEKHDRARS